MKIGNRIVDTRELYHLKEYKPLTLKYISLRVDLILWLEFSFHLGNMLNYINTIKEIK